MPVASMPSDYGCGDFGKYCYEFIDSLSEVGIDLWQILPLNPTGYGYSPYQPYSSYAGDHIYISMDKLYDEGLLEKKPEQFDKDSIKIDYSGVEKYKEKYLREAFENFKADSKYQEFISESWVYLYSVFYSLKVRNNLICWNEWPERQKTIIHELLKNISNTDILISEGNRILKSMCETEGYDSDVLIEDIRYEMFLQYMFNKQWLELKEYANNKGISIIGDIPFYVGIDSLDVWMNQEVFLLDADSKPSFIAGVPPDYFSETGQRWGNPIYDWEYLERTGFRFWLDRLKGCSKLFDIIRIDHFRAFDTYWKIPASCDTAIEGDWIEAPGYKFFIELYREMPDINIVVEDLGELRPEVHQLRDYFSFKGMKVLQFTYDPLENNNNFPDRENMVLYTGTHDNQTIRGWYDEKDDEFKEALDEDLSELGYDEKEIEWKFIHYAFDSIADMALVTMQDLLGLGDEARINTPGTLGSPNWEWKLKDFKEFRNKINRLKLIL